MTEIYFIRHAESFGNLTRRAYGWYDGIITPKGYEQIKKLAERFKEIDVDAVYSSDLTRAMKTASAIYEPKGLKLQTDPDLRELGLGAWEDRPWGEFPLLFEKGYEAWTRDQLNFKIEGSETYLSVYKRMRGALERIVSENKDKTVAIVSHGAALRMLMHGIINNDDLSDINNASWGDNTSVSLFRTDGKEYTPVFLNSNTHLEQMSGFKENLSWVREGAGQNLFIKNAELPQDIEKIHSYYKAAWLEIFNDDINYRDVDKKIQRLSKKDPENVIFAYSVDKEAGMLVLDPSEKLFKDTGHISFLYLNLDFRGRRFGIQLVGHAMSKYRELGKKHISVRVASNNTRAQQFYKKYGFYELFSERDGKTLQTIMLLDII